MLEIKVMKKWKREIAGAMVGAPPRAGHGNNRAVVVLPSLLLVVCMFWLSCTKKAETEPAPTVDVAVAVAEKTSIQHKVSGDAVLYPLKQASMMPKISAPLTTYLVNRGSHVHAGEVVAQLENQDLAAAATENKGGYEQAQAAFETATKETLPEELKKAELDLKGAKAALDAQKLVLENRRALFDQGAISRKEVDDARVTYTQAQNAYDLAEQHLQSVQRVARQQDVKAARGQLTAAQGKYQGAQAQLSYSEIRSPIDGVVTDRPLNPGEMAAAGSPVVTVMDISQVIARAHIPQQEAATLKLGDTATISVPGMTDDVAGKVTIVSPALDPNSTTVEVWVQASNRGEKLKPGASVRVTIVTETIQDAVVIPTEALLTAADGTTSVIIASGDKPVLKTVKVGVKNADTAQIVEGLVGGEKVVTVGAFELSREDPDVLEKTKIRIQAPKSSDEEKGGEKEPEKGPEKE